MTQETMTSAPSGWAVDREQPHGLALQACAAAAQSRTGYTVAKRTLDVFVSLIGIIICLPLWAIIVVCIKLDSRGPAIFRQSRPGRNGVPFTLLKFRTMVHDAEQRLPEIMHMNLDPTGTLIRIKDDPRLTRVGRFLRNACLDETPQFINILLGQMSLVGPRPISRPIADPRNHIRLRVRPGLTGLWQVSRCKNTTVAFMIDKDLEYICKRSILFDLAIIIQTVLFVLRRNGAR